MIHRRVLWFPVLTQAMHVFPLLLLAQAIQVLVRFFVHRPLPRLAALHRKRGRGRPVAGDHLAAAGAAAPRGRPRPHPPDLSDTEPVDDRN